MNEQSNPDLPTLQAWRVTNAAPANRFTFERNPFYHRVDAAGHQLPYVDRIIMDVAAGGLLAAKANAGEADLLFRGLTMADIPILKEGERFRGYKTHLWPNARGSELALYPSLNAADPVWRALNRDVRFRRALSLAIDRKTLNNALLFGLGTEGNNTIMAESPLFSPELRTTHATYDPAEASRLLDEIGLTKRNGAGIRLLPDGRELEIIVETDGEGGLIVDGLDPDRRVLARGRRAAVRQAAGPHHPAQPLLLGPHHHGGLAGARQRHPHARPCRPSASRRCSRTTIPGRNGASTSRPRARAASPPTCPRRSACSTITRPGRPPPTRP